VRALWLLPQRGPIPADRALDEKAQHGGYLQVQVTQQQRHSARGHYKKGAAAPAPAVTLAPAAVPAPASAMARLRQLRRGCDCCIRTGR